MSTEKHRYSPRHERLLDAPLDRVQALIWEFISLIPQWIPCRSSVTSLSVFFFLARGWDLMSLRHEQRKKKWRYSYNYSDVALIFFLKLFKMPPCWRKSGLLSGPLADKTQWSALRGGVAFPVEKTWWVPYMLEKICIRKLAAISILAAKIETTVNKMEFQLL